MSENFFRDDELEWLARASGRMDLTSPMFSDALTEIVGRTDVVPSARARKYVDRSHKIKRSGLGGARTHNQRLKRALLYH
jgi:hypothetical protein